MRTYLYLYLHLAEREKERKGEGEKEREKRERAGEVVTEGSLALLISQSIQPARFRFSEKDSFFSLKKERKKYLSFFVCVCDMKG